MKFINSIKGLLSPESRSFWIMLAVVVPGIPAIGLSVSAVLSQEFQCWLIGSDPNSETGSTTIRNLGLIIAGLVALPLAIWRGYVAHRQSNTAQEQVDKSQQQVETAQQGLRNERYQKAAEMLGNEVLAVRLGGIYALQQLDEDHPEEYHVQIMRLLCAFARNPTEDQKYESTLTRMFGLGNPFIRADVQAVMDVIGKREEARIALEEKSSYWPDLAGANLKKLRMFRGNLRNVILVDADLSNSLLVDTDLTNAVLGNADLSEANIFGVILSGAFLRVNLDQETKVSTVRSY